MTRAQLLARSACALALNAGLAGWAMAQSDGPKETSVEEVVVTGSYIRGTPEDAAQPVDVVTAQALEQQGSPSVVQLVKTITAAGAALGEANRSLGAQASGNASINLRGLGPARTLTLMNGHRLADSANAGGGLGANLLFVPSAAVGRIEILKDGAAATYGSDAMGGVVNFITRRDLEGFEFSGQYAAIDGSKGDYEGNLAYGWRDDRGNILLTAGYRHRSRLDMLDRGWAKSPYEDPNYGGWTGATNPGFYVANTASLSPAILFRDNGCAELGGVLTNGATGRPVSPASALVNGGAATSTCRFEFTQLSDLVTTENHYQLYAEANYDLSDKVQMHVEAAWTRNDVPNQRISPANLSTQFPTPTSLGGTSGSLAPPGAFNFFVRYNVPQNNPGLDQLAADCAGGGGRFGEFGTAQCASITAAATAGALGVDISPTAWRAIAFAGHPTTNSKSAEQDVHNDSWRVSASLNGDFDNGIHWDAALTYMDATSSHSNSDILVNRLQNALNGFGSRQGDANECSAAERSVAANAGNAAAGCYFFNPFTNSVATSVINGQANPYYRAGVANDPRLIDWMIGRYTNTWTNQLLVADAVLTGDLPVFELPGGQVQWAIGAQYRYQRELQYSGDFFDNQTFPCVDSIDDSVPVCGAPAGPLIFFGSGRDRDLDRSVPAGFLELRLPLFDNFEANIAVRHERYGGGVGSTTNPRIALRWQALDWLAFRGSAGTTFRAPTLESTTSGFTRSVANISGQYRAVRTNGNPDLQPETAHAYNGGILVDFRRFKASLDYWRFDFKDELTTESSTALFSAMFPAVADASTWACLGGARAVPELAARFNFGGVCAPGNVLEINTSFVNGPNTRTSGFDFSAQYDWPDVYGGDLTVGFDGTYLKEFRRGAFSLLGAPQVVFQQPVDRAGTSDLVGSFFSYPQLRANGFVNFNRGPLNARWQVRYTEGTKPAPGTPANRWVLQGSDYVQVPVGKSKAYVQHDLTVRYDAPWDTTVTFSIQNVLDTDPSDAPGAYNYDITNGNPLGRVFEVGFKKTF